MLYNQNFIAPLATVMQTETKKNIDRDSSKDKRQPKFVEATYNTGVWLEPLSNRSLKHIYDKQKNEKAYLERSQEPTPERSPQNAATASGSRSTESTPKMAKK